MGPLCLLQAFAAAVEGSPALLLGLGDALATGSTYVARTCARSAIGVQALGQVDVLSCEAIHPVADSQHLSEVL
jgi:hypothetical protein